MKPVRNFRWKILTVVLPLLGLFVVWIGIFQYARPWGGADMGRLYLAGATSILVEHDYPVTQRPPFYSLLLAGLGYVERIDTSKSVTAARDLGNVEGMEMAEGFRKTSYRQTVLIFQAILWVLTAVLILKVSKWAEVRSPFTQILFLMMLIPSSWLLVLYIHDAVLSQLLLVTAIAALAFSMKRGFSTGSLIIAGICLALSGLSRSTFQLISPFLLLVLSFPILWNLGRRSFMKFVAVILIPWLVFVGGWSLRNYQRFGFFGVSSVLGSALSTRTANFLEKAQPFFPDVVPAFLTIRQEKKDRWGTPALKWLMMNKGLTYVQANQLLTKVNLRAIRSSPILYSYEIAQSLISFHIPYVPRWPILVRAPALALEALVILCFILLTVLWLGFHVLYRISPLIPRSIFTVEDTLILGVQAIYWYTAFISAAVDIAKPEHRSPVELLMPLSIVLIAHRLRIGELENR
jgi:hypothetical protein